MYPTLLVAHSLLRWAVVALGLLASLAALGQPAAARRRVLPFVIALDLQVILGVVLWAWLSPATSLRGGFADPEVRHFTLAHPAVGLSAVLLAHLANVFLKRGLAQARTLVFLALAGVLLAVPWDRPLFRF